MTYSKPHQTKLITKLLNSQNSKKTIKQTTRKNKNI